VNISIVIFITLVAALLGSFSQLSYKKGLPNRLEKITHILRLFRNKYILAGGGGYLISLVIYLYALSKAPLSIVYPVFASTFIFVPVLAAISLKEKLNAQRAFGIGLIFIGIIVVALTG
jgi:drug/metabolite transporter (DMT)-like permease